MRTLSEQIAKLQTPPPPAQPTVEAPPYDRAVYDELARTYGPDKAEAYRLDETQKYEQRKLQESLDARLKPIEEMTQRTEMENRTAALFSRAKEVKGPDGQLLFPEFSHDEASKAIVEIWTELHPEQAVTPAGIRMAVDIYRGRVALGMSRPLPPPPARPAPSGQSVAPSVGGPGPGSAPGAPHNPATSIPRSLKVDPITGERFV